MTLKPLPAAIAVMAVVSLTLHLMGSLCPDVTWINYGAEHMLRGETLYKDIIEVNPPVIYILSMPPYWLAMVAGWSGHALYVAWVVIIALLSVGLTLALPADPEVKRSRSFQWLVAGQAFAGLLLVGESLGQREHFVFLFACPYVLLTALRMMRVPVHGKAAALAGFCAGLAILLKPHYAILPVALEVLRLRWMGWQFRSLFRPETSAGLVSFVGGTIGMVLAYPEFFTHMVPLGRIAYLPYYHSPLHIVLLMAAIPAAATAIAAVMTRKEQTAFQAALLTSAAASTLVALIQARGFPYHFIPAVSFISIWAATLLARRRDDGWRWDWAVGLLPLLFLAQINSFLPFDGLKFGKSKAEAAQQEGMSVAILSTNLGNIFPLVTDSGLKWTLRVPSIWYAPFLESVDLRSAQGLPVAEDELKMAEDLRRQTLDDLIARKPEMLFVESGYIPMLRREIDLPAVLGKDPRWNSFMAGYDKQYQEDRITAYRRR